MMVRRFARPYAKAIMDVAGSTQKAAEVQSELERFDAARRLSVELQEVFANPGIEASAKVAVANAIADRLSMSPMSRKVLEVLIQNWRINDLEAIIAALAAYVNEATNTVVAEVASAHALSEGEVEQLRLTLEKKMGKHVTVQVTKNAELLGGFVARIGSEILDASVAGKIEKFRESLS
jgi:F-type H+-transporting ATPase subunit delta